MSQFALPTHRILIIVFLGYHTCQYTITWENGLNSVTDTCVDFDPFARLSAAIRPENIVTYFCYTSQVTDVGLHILEMFFGNTLRISVAPFRVTRFGYTFWIHITNISRSFRVTHVGYTLRISVDRFG